MKKILITLLAVLSLASCTKVQVSDLRTENMVAPQNINSTTPRLSWIITSKKNDVMQTAYHLLVATSPDLLKEGKADLWDSKKVESDASIWVPYGGKELKSEQQVFWKVKVYTTKGESRWSDVAEWSMGLLSQSEWKAQWIGHDALYEGESIENQKSRVAARYLRHEFTTENNKIKRAIVHVSGLGLYELYINGQRIGNDVLTPGPTDWRQRIFYNTYDVTEQITEANAIGVVLGSGRYVTLRTEDTIKQQNMFGMPKLRLQLDIEYTDGNHQIVTSNESWRICHQGPIVANNDYDGEIYDARNDLGDWSNVGYDDSKWENAELASNPGGIMMGNPNENMRVKKEIKAVKVWQTGVQRYIVDFGQNIAGTAVVRISNKNEGDTITMRFAEILRNNDSLLYTDNLRSAMATDRYICSGKEDKTLWHPTFVTHGFRFMEVQGMIDINEEDFYARLIFDDMADASTFSTDNDVINAIYRNAWWGIADNYKGFPLDCPQRDERMPWLGDRTAGCYGESFMFNNSNMYAKWMTDICLSQQADGNIPSVCPNYWRIMSPNMTWPAALPMGCDMLYKHFGNLQPMAESYPYIQKFMAFMMASFMDQDSIITKDTFGDWCMPSESQELIHSKDPARITSGALMSTAYYVKICQMMAEYAPLIGHAEDVTEWHRHANNLTKAFNKRFLHLEETTDDKGQKITRAYYDNNTATANVLPLAFGMVPQQWTKQVEANIIDKIMNENKGHVSCGVVGMSWIQRELTRMGHGDIAFMLASNTTWPSYGYMIGKGATTIWELWNGDTAEPSMNSGNHVMLLGDLITWFFKDLAGIQPAEPGYKKIRMAPDFLIKDLGKVEATYKSPYGTIASRYTRKGDNITWNVTIPCNTTATIVLPVKDEKTNSGISYKEKEVGSGSYEFTLSL